MYAYCPIHGLRIEPLALTCHECGMPLYRPVLSDSGRTLNQWLRMDGGPTELEREQARKWMQWEAGQC